MKKFLILIILLVVVVAGVATLNKQQKPAPSPVPVAAFKRMAAYTGLKRIRFMAWSPDGRLFLTDMKDLSDNSEGKVYVLENFDEATKTFTTIHTYLENLRNPNSIAFYEGPARPGDSGRSGGWLYVALTDRLVRYPYKAGDNSPSGPAQTLASFPDYGLSYKYGGWHLTRTIAIDAQKHKLYVSLGSSCNSCEEKPEEIRAEILVMNPDGTDAKPYATGLRNAVGLAIVDGDLWATDMGADHLGDDKPNDLLYKISPGTNYGWPYCYESAGAVYADSNKTWERKFDCTQVPVAFAEFDAHSAPLGLARWRDGFLVALHGSGDKKLARGDKIVYVDHMGHVSDVVVDLGDATTRTIRPADIITMEKDGAFLFTDDLGGTLYYVGP